MRPTLLEEKTNQRKKLKGKKKIKDVRPRVNCQGPSKVRLRFC